MEDHAAIAAEIRERARELGAVICAHTYQRAEVQQAADFVGDSLNLARYAAASEADVIVLAGVHFMAETAAILAPAKTVLLPRTDAGCPMADMITPESLRRWKSAHPGVPVVTYVNTSAAVKAESDVCVTSANAVEVVRALGASRILFAPDRNLGAWVARSLPEIAIELWPGWCPVHDDVTPEHVHLALDSHPDAEVIAHPECRPAVLDLADAVLSTSQMLRHVAASPASEFIVVTESGILHGLAAAAPGKRFIELAPRMLCPNMKITRLADVRDALLDAESHTVVVPDEIRIRALRAVERMVAVG